MTKHAGSHNKRELSQLETLLFFACFVFYLLPSVSAVVPLSIVTVVLVGYVLYITNKRLPFVGRVAKKYILIIAFIAGCYFVFTETATISKAVSNYNLKRYLGKFNQLLSLFFPTILCYRTITKGSSHQKQLFLWFSLILFGYVMINTYSELQYNVNITRSWANFGEQAQENIATYAYVYAVSALIPALVQVYYLNRVLYIKLLSVPGIIFSVAFLLKAQYTLALLIAVVGIVMAIIQHIKSTPIKVLLVVMIPLIFFMIPALLSYIANQVESEQIAMRLNEVSQAFLSGDTSSYNLNGRLTLYSYAIEYFFKSPIWGNRTVPFDGHSTFLTALCDVGLLGSIPLYYLFFSMKDILGRFIDKDRLRLVFPSILSFWLMGFVNPIHSAPILGFTVWFMVPMLIDVSTFKERCVAYE